jgi:Protein of unknown function (DUF3604)
MPKAMRGAGVPVAALVLALAFGCRARAPEGAGAGPSTRSPGARPDIVESLRADRRARRHPADGGGRAWIEKGPRAVVAGGSGAWTLVYEAGPLGIAAGGNLFLQVSPFWGWSTPQVEREDGAGYARVTTDAPGVTLVPSTLDQQLLGIRVEGRALEAGKHVRIDYGAGPQGARVDRYAERGSRLWVAVDGDGDGVRGLLPDSPAVDVLPGSPERLVLTAPSVVRPGERLPLHLAVLDAEGDAWPRVEGQVRLRATAGVEMPSRVRLVAADRGCQRVDVVAGSEEIVRFEATGPGSLHGSSNPLVVSRSLPRVYWGDLHGHSSLSDGTGTPDDYFRYARDVAALDVAALTDHDHWGMQPLAAHPALWEEIRAQVRAFHEPGRFITLLGYEWTSWTHGHRHVLYFGDEGRIFDSVDPAFESPQKLWDGLRGQSALTITHHTAGGPIAANWNIPPDPALEPVTEVASVHGSSEAPDSPHVIYDSVAGNFARDALGRGYRLGFVGSGDSHDGHPGLAHLASHTGGLVALLADQLTRDGVLEALRARRVYATNGPRIVLHATLDGAPMGTIVAAGNRSVRALEVLVVGTAALERVDLVRGGKVARTFAGTGSTEMRLAEPVSGLTAGEYVYLRAVQEDGGAAWSSPFFVD